MDEIDEEIARLERLLDFELSRLPLGDTSFLPEGNDLSDVYDRLDALRAKKAGSLH